MAEPTPKNQSSLPITAHNRSVVYNRTRDELIGTQSGDSIISQLEGTPSVKRGSRKQPSIIKYPKDIGQSQVPHIMQFKIFWRWERPDLKNKLDGMKAESTKVIGLLQKWKQASLNGDPTREFTVEDMQKMPEILGDEDASFLTQILQDKRIANAVDSRSNLMTTLHQNPRAGRALLENIVLSEQHRVETISKYGSDMLGKVGIDDDERLAERAGLNEEVANLSAVAVGANIGLATAAWDFFSNISDTAVAYASGGKKAAFKAAGKQALKSGAIGLGAGAAAGLATAALQYGQAAPVYDQMVSIYLPTCTKINQVDAFAYKDGSMSVAGGMADLLGGEMGEGVKQAALGLTTKIADTKNLGDAVAALSGRVLNPRLEKLFQTKGIREFSFSWDFYPRSPEEVANIKDIIDTFRYHSHPALSKSEESSGGNPPSDESIASTKIMLRVPAEYEIRFLSSSNNPASVGYEENPYIPKIGRCVVSNITVDYSPNGVFSTFQDNAPTAISLTINVSEVTAMTRETVEKGY